MIKVIHYQNEEIDKKFEASISKYYDEVRKLLPELPKSIQIYFSDYGILPDAGVGGFAYAPEIITISIDPDFKDKDAQRRELRATIFHEAFHVNQNYTGEGGPFSAVENALYEGMATVFEREYCGKWQPYGDYRKTTTELLQQWLEELQNLSLKEFEENYSDWKFYHPKLKEQWIVYKVGTWLVDEVLARYKLTIMDLCNKTAKDVLDLHNL